MALFCDHLHRSQFLAPYGHSNYAPVPHTPSAMNTAFHVRQIPLSGSCDQTEVVLALVGQFSWIGRLTGHQASQVLHGWLKLPASLSVDEGYEPFQPPNDSIPRDRKTEAHRGTE